jgi:histidine triad (HIT) family protein
LPDDCLFCRIVAGDEDAHFVFEDDTCVAFLDARPLFPGHTLLVPMSSSRPSLPTRSA